MAKKCTPERKKCTWEVEALHLLQHQATWCFAVQQHSNLSMKIQHACESGCAFYVRFLCVYLCALSTTVLLPFIIIFLLENHFVLFSRLLRCINFFTDSFVALKKWRHWVCFGVTHSHKTIIFGRQKAPVPNPTLFFPHTHQWNIILEGTDCCTFNRNWLWMELAQTTEL